MAKVTITIEDQDEKGTVTFCIESDPAFPVKDPTTMTVAQSVSIEAWDQFMKTFKEREDRQKQQEQESQLLELEVKKGKKSKKTVASVVKSVN